MQKDLISRQMAVDTIMGQPPEPHYPAWYAAQIEDLPPAQNKCTHERCPLQYNYVSNDCDISECPWRTVRKQGHWIGGDGSYICSECGGNPMDFINTMGISFDAYIETPMSYCPHCGADMRGMKNG